MIGIGVELLTGRYVATAHHRRDQGEWPPHPARLFSAMVDAWAEREDATEAETLRAMEGWGPPAIVASEAAPRNAVVHYVPTNDVSVVSLTQQTRRYMKVADALARLAEPSGGARAVERAARDLAKHRDVAAQTGSAGGTPPKQALALLPTGRGKQPRMYPSVTPAEEAVTFLWPDIALTSTQIAVLDRLLERVTALGHSSSLVNCQLVWEAHEPRFVPDPAGEVVLRTVGPGQFDALREAFSRHEGGRPRSLPHRAVSYRDRSESGDPESATSTSLLSGDLLVLERTSGARLPLTRTAQLAASLRSAVMSYADNPLPEALTGRYVKEDGRSVPSQRPHAAFVALPFVGHRYATGHVMGMAVLIPPGFDEGERAAVTDAIGRWRRDSGEVLELRLGSSGVMRLSRMHDAASSVTLARRTWAGPATVWDSVTPIALGRHPGDLWGGSPRRVERAHRAAASTVAQACGHVGLPAPTSVAVQLSPLMTGSRDARDFPEFVQGRGQAAVRRALVHARIVFPEPVTGPLVVGAGRYRGLGLLRPGHKEES